MYLLYQTFVCFSTFIPFFILCFEIKFTPQNKNINNLFNKPTCEVINIDDIVIGGIYVVNTSTTGTLPRVGYGLLFVKRVYDWIYQDLYYTFEDGLHHHHRKRINTGDWTPWYSYASTKNVGECWNLKGGTYIAPNSNLDDFKTIGSYYNHSNVESATITNNPAGVAFTMQVYSSTGDANTYITQEFRSYSKDGGIYIRKYDTYSQAWSEWFKLVQDNNITNCYIDFGEISLASGVTVKSYNFSSMYPNYKLIGVPIPMLYYTNSHAYAQITFAGYYGTSGDLRIYSDRAINARIALRCLAIKK